MFFQIQKIILWSKANHPPRVINLKQGVVNVISGASKTGKSAVIPIIDYCLGSGKCSIPVGTIRQTCSWFGIIIMTSEGKKLLARREPGTARQTSDMFLAEGNNINIEIQPQKNTDVESVKSMLNRLSTLSNLPLNPLETNGFQSRVSFRDLMAFTFQPQFIIANPMVLFFNADTAEHREKLKAIFPYVLGALTQDMLLAKWEIEQLLRELRRSEVALSAARAVSKDTQSEIRDWIFQAIEYGLLPQSTKIPANSEDTVYTLRSILKANVKTSLASLNSIENSLAQLQALRNEESKTAKLLYDARRHLSTINKLITSSDEYFSAINIQKDRLRISEFLLNEIQETDDPLATHLHSSRKKLTQLVEALKGREVEIKSHPRMSDSFDKERMRARADVEEYAQKLSLTRQSIAALEHESETARHEIFKQDSIARFLGRIEQALHTLEKTLNSAELDARVFALRAKISELHKIYAPAHTRDLQNNALRVIESVAESIIPNLDAEWPNTPIQLSIDDLTVKVMHNDRNDYLWEIGSGANWLTYHIATTLALQIFFIKKQNHPVPGFLVYDQPSQVYFPQGFGLLQTEPHNDTSRRSRDEDIAAVRDVFKSIAKAVRDSNGQLQAIILDHAGNEVWGDIDGVSLVEEWRGKTKLVPTSWLE